jgi:hypothetical protein
MRLLFICSISFPDTSACHVEGAVAMPGKETQRRRQREDEDAHTSWDAGDPRLMVDNMSTLRSLDRLTSGLVDLGYLIAGRLRERVAKRRAKGG